MQSFSILQMGRGCALNKRLFASFLLYHNGVIMLMVGSLFAQTIGTTKCFSTEGMKRLEQNTPYRDSYAKQLYPFIFQCIGESSTDAQVYRIGQNLTLHRQ